MKLLEKKRDELAHERAMHVSRKYTHNELTVYENAKRSHAKGFDAAIKELEPIINELVEALKDFAEYGTRHDLNPTGQFEPCGCFNSFEGDYWQGYIKSQDFSVRTRAEEALNKYKQMMGE